MVGHCSGQQGLTRARGAVQQHTLESHTHTDRLSIHAFSFLFISLLESTDTCLALVPCLDQGPVQQYTLKGHAHTHSGSNLSAHDSPRGLMWARGLELHGLHKRRSTTAAGQKQIRTHHRSPIHEFNVSFMHPRKHLLIQDHPQGSGLYNPELLHIHLSIY